ncbi:alpha/beta hydrolase [Nonomuraea jabiensis]|uniref:Pimeloyl-ACP methyl ester carboxylesterase n=1 Tax=Nonomuraea jabiensis TaxID=882448 RepID=A0A7W9FXJ0_9ACTN|nr:alpha/beta hydrolase [Nonomuraea jabiensis]MBB5773405.1 pimeloyl-ACP methyl ester carboxylesterase [Nonomuraea jabiensis]
MRLRVHPHVMVSGDGGHGVPCEIGTLEVPQVRSRPGSRTIELAFARFPGRGPGPALIYLEGGPGASGLSTWRELPGRYLPFLEYGDVVVFDQRGTGASRPCLESPFTMDLPLDRVIDRAEFLAESVAKAEATAAFWRERGADLDGYTTEESADDVADLMSALGYETFRTIGGSYGSHLSLSVIRRHGHRLDRSVLYAIEGPDDTYKLPSATDRHLARLAAMAAGAPELDGRVPDLPGLMERVFDRLAKTPAEVDGVVIGEFDVRYLTVSGLGQPSFLRRLPGLFLAMEGGDFTPWAGHVRRLRTGRAEALMPLVMDGASGATAARLDRIAAEAAASPFGDLMNLPFPGVAAAVGGPDLGDGFRAPVRSDVPALLVNGTLDGRTPETNALAVLEGLANGHLILVENAAHEFARDQVWAALSEFMGGRTPELSRARLGFEFVPDPREL